MILMWCGLALLGESWMFEFCCFLEGGVGAVEGMFLCFGFDSWDGKVGKGEVGSGEVGIANVFLGVCMFGCVMNGISCYF